MPNHQCNARPLSMREDVGAGIFRLVIFAAALPLYAGSIAGNVTSAQSHKSIESALVEILPSNRQAITGSEGTYAFDSISPGTYTVVCSREGFESQSVSDVYVSGNGEKRVDIELLPLMFQLDKMVVRSAAFRKAPDMSTSTKVMSFDEILRSPGGLVDVQRVVQDLPSVASGGDNVNEVVVRGGMPGENQLVMDNVEIPNPNHFAQQGSGGGVVSLINPLLVRGLTFNAGAPPAQYGGKASSVIDVKLREGNDRIILGGVDLGLAGVGGHLEGPLWPASTFMASGHRSFLDFASSFQSTVAVPQFWGVQAKMTQRAGSHLFYTNGIFGRNSIVIENSKSDLGLDYDIVESGGTIYVGAFNWDAVWGERLSSNVLVSGTGNTFDRLNYDPSTISTVSDTGFFNGSVEQEQTLKASLSYDFDNSARVMVGAFVRRCDFDIDMRDKPDTLTAYHYDLSDSMWMQDSLIRTQSGAPVVLSEIVRRHDKGYKYGGFVSAIVPLFDRLRVIPGVRADGFDYTGGVCVSPRLSAVFSLARSLDLTGAFGIQFQDPDYTDLVKHPANDDLDAKMALSGIGGVEYTLEQFNTRFIIEGYYKDYRNIAVDSSLAFADTGLTGRFAESKRMYSIGKARSYGIEFFAQKKLTEFLFYTAAYSFSRAQSRDPRPGRDAEWYDGDFDFRHALTVTGGAKFEMLEHDWYQRIHKKLWFMLLSPVMPIADRMEFSAKWRFLGGRPYTEQLYDSTYRQWYVDRGGELNGLRYDQYHRLDIRWERRYGFGFVHMIYYFDFQNIYNRDNIWQYIYPDSRGEKQPVYQFPFFPAGGIIIGF